MSTSPEYRTVRVELGPRAYDVVIGRGLLDRVAELLAERVRGPLAIITDKTVNKLFAQRVERHPKLSGFAPFVLEIEPGESSKSMSEVTRLLSEIAKRKVPRSGTVMGMGGGVVGDLAGFIAASYLRGLPFVQVPTTLLAMVDSSVGGKTGVNLPEGKNLVGAFYQPKLVIIDLDTLNSFIPSDPNISGASYREFPAGMAEVIKYGAIKDRALFERVAKGVEPDDADLAEIVEKCVSIKARIVENDEFETKGERALLNFGHTIGHAIEKATGYTRYLHGEAIALGMRAAAWLSRQETGLAQEDARDIEVALLANQLPVVLDPAVKSEDILAALGNDKKVAADGENRWVLLTRIGEAETGRKIAPEKVARAVEYLRTHPDDL
jgi:3-dehydroquinate synthase